MRAAACPPRAHLLDEREQLRERVPVPVRAALSRIVHRLLAQEVGRPQSTHSCESAPPV
jgi:hypothetical protein